MLRYLFVPALLFFSIAAAQEPGNYAFTGVHVVSMDSDAVLTDLTVVVQQIALPRSERTELSKYPTTRQ